MKKPRKKRLAQHREQDAAAAEPSKKMLASQPSPRGAPSLPGAPAPLVAEKRVRRSADDAQAQILDAAERRLLLVGPGGIRLQEIAADVGVSHPAILHHFGNREGLVRAVVDRALVSLQQDLVEAFPARSAVGDNDGMPDGPAMLERVAETLAVRGHGRLLAWLILSGYDEAFDVKAVQDNWKTINDAMHAIRVAMVEEANKTRAKGTKAIPLPDHEDTVFTVMLSALAIFGQSIAGPMMFRMGGIGGEPRASGRRFRTWLSGVLIEHMSGGVVPAPAAAPPNATKAAKAPKPSTA